MSIQTLYTASVTATGGREGRVISDDGKLDLKLALPKGLGGPGGDATNPEQLFAGGYAACFESAIRFVARERGIKLESAFVTAIVGVGPRAAGGFGLTVALKVSLPDFDKSVATELATYAHEVVCPYSHATRGNLDVTIEII
ncbi:organic hydroperoxide resistance protein [Leeia sp. TBRC 13508]|uniref:Organic hydroperoxide resistance protein n=1 Tax=Leeia speluncae TaxID=2884804 RepID=A0ABS8D3C3_9NEIS|nr:organic hydroperoxide resistance protein [Leeia speluncae]MCB6182501.1 organic hydroperoxide resistance protein [Leeia speluncae]